MPFEKRGWPREASTRRARRSSQAGEAGDIGVSITRDMMNKELQEQASQGELQV